MEDLNNRKVREVIVDTTPHPAFIVNSKCLSIGQAVVEFADNSYQAESSVVKVSFVSEFLIVMDNGKGMNLDEMTAALTFGMNVKVRGLQTTETVINEKSLSLFGTGLKRSLYYLSKEGFVSSSSSNDRCDCYLSSDIIMKQYSDSPNSAYNLPIQIRFNNMYINNNMFREQDEDYDFTKLAMNDLVKSEILEIIKTFKDSYGHLSTLLIMKLKDDIIGSTINDKYFNDLEIELSDALFYLIKNDLKLFLPNIKEKSQEDWDSFVGGRNGQIKIFLEFKLSSGDKVLKILPTENSKILQTLKQTQAVYHCKIEIPTDLFSTPNFEDKTKEQREETERKNGNKEVTTTMELFHLYMPFNDGEETRKIKDIYFWQCHHLKRFTIENFKFYPQQKKIKNRKPTDDINLLERTTCIGFLSYYVPVSSDKTSDMSQQVSLGEKLMNLDDSRIEPADIETSFKKFIKNSHILYDQEIIVSDKIDSGSENDRRLFNKMGYFKTLTYKNTRIVKESNIIRIEDKYGDLYIQLIDFTVPIGKLDSNDDRYIGRDIQFRFRQLPESFYGDAIYEKSINDIKFDCDNDFNDIFVKQSIQAFLMDNVIKEVTISFFDKSQNNNSSSLDTDCLSLISRIDENSSNVSFETEKEYQIGFQIFRTDADDLKLTYYESRTRRRSTDYLVPLYILITSNKIDNKDKEVLERVPIKLSKTSIKDCTNLQNDLRNRASSLEDWFFMIENIVFDKVGKFTMLIEVKNNYNICLFTKQITIDIKSYKIVSFEIISSSSIELNLDSLSMDPLRLKFFNDLKQDISFIKEFKLRIYNSKVKLIATSSDDEWISFKIDNSEDKKFFLKNETEYYITNPQLNSLSTVPIITINEWNHLEENLETVNPFTFLSKTEYKTRLELFTIDVIVKNPFKSDDTVFLTKEVEFTLLPGQLDHISFSNQTLKCIIGQNIPLVYLGFFDKYNNITKPLERIISEFEDVEKGFQSQITILDGHDLFDANIISSLLLKWIDTCINEAKIYDNGVVAFSKEMCLKSTTRLGSSNSNIFGVIDITFNDNFEEPVQHSTSLEFVISVKEDDEKIDRIVLYTGDVELDQETWENESKKYQSLDNLKLKVYSISGNEIDYDLHMQISFDCKGKNEILNGFLFPNIEKTFFDQFKITIKCTLYNTCHDLSFERETFDNNQNENNNSNRVNDNLDSDVDRDNNNLDNDVDSDVDRDNNNLDNDVDSTDEIFVSGRMEVVTSSQDTDRVGEEKEDTINNEVITAYSIDDYPILAQAILIQHEQVSSSHNLIFNNDNSTQRDATKKQWEWYIHLSSQIDRLIVEDKQSWKSIFDKGIQLRDENAREVEIIDFIPNKKPVFAMSFLQNHLTSFFIQIPLLELDKNRYHINYDQLFEECLPMIRANRKNEEKAYFSTVPMDETNFKIYFAEISFRLSTEKAFKITLQSDNLIQEENNNFIYYCYRFMAINDVFIILKDKYGDDIDRQTIISTAAGNLTFQLYYEVNIDEKIFIKDIVVKAKIPQNFKNFKCDFNLWDYSELTDLLNTNNTSSIKIILTGKYYRSGIEIIELQSAELLVTILENSMVETIDLKNDFQIIEKYQRNNLQFIIYDNYKISIDKLSLPEVIAKFIIAKGETMEESVLKNNLKHIKLFKLKSNIPNIENPFFTDVSMQSFIKLRQWDFLEIDKYFEITNNWQEYQINLKPIQFDEPLVGKFLLEIKYEDKKLPIENKYKNKTCYLPIDVIPGKLVNLVPDNKTKIFLDENHNELSNTVFFNFEFKFHLEDQFHNKCNIDCASSLNDLSRFCSCSLVESSENNQYDVCYNIEAENDEMIISNLTIDMIEKNSNNNNIDLKLKFTSDLLDNIELLSKKFIFVNVDSIYIKLASERVDYENKKNILLKVEEEIIMIKKLTNALIQINEDIENILENGFQDYESQLPEKFQTLIVNDKVIQAKNHILEIDKNKDKQGENDPSFEELYEKIQTSLGSADNNLSDYFIGYFYELISVNYHYIKYEKFLSWKLKKDLESIIVTKDILKDKNCLKYCFENNISIIRTKTDHDNIKLENFSDNNNENLNMRKMLVCTKNDPFSISLFYDLIHIFAIETSNILEASSTNSNCDCYYINDDCVLTASGRIESLSAANLKYRINHQKFSESLYISKCREICILDSCRTNINVEIKQHQAAKEDLLSSYCNSLDKLKESINTSKQCIEKLENQSRDVAIASPQFVRQQNIQSSNNDKKRKSFNHSSSNNLHFENENNTQENDTDNDNKRSRISENAVLSEVIPAKNSILNLINIMDGQEIFIGFSNPKEESSFHYYSGAILFLENIENETKINEIITCLSSNTTIRQSKIEKLTFLLQDDSFHYNYFKITNGINERNECISEKIHKDGFCGLRVSLHIILTVLEVIRSNLDSKKGYELLIEGYTESSISNSYDKLRESKTNIQEWYLKFSELREDKVFWLKEFENDENASVILKEFIDNFYKICETFIPGLEDISKTYLNLEGFFFIQTLITEINQKLREKIQFSVFRVSKVEDDLLTPIASIIKDKFLSELPSISITSKNLSKEIKSNVVIFSLVFSTTNPSCLAMDTGKLLKKASLNFSQLKKTLNPLYYIWHQMGEEENETFLQDSRSNHYTIFPYPKSYIQEIEESILPNSSQGTGEEPKSADSNSSNETKFVYCEINNEYNEDSEIRDLDKIINNIAISMVSKAEIYFKVEEAMEIETNNDSNDNNNE